MAHENACCFTYLAVGHDNRRDIIVIIVIRSITGIKTRFQYRQRTLCIVAMCYRNIIYSRSAVSCVIIFSGTPVRAVCGGPCARTARFVRAISIHRDLHKYRYRSVEESIDRDVSPSAMLSRGWRRLQQQYCCCCTRMTRTAFGPGPSQETRCQRAAVVYSFAGEIRGRVKNNRLDTFFFLSILLLLLLCSL